MFCHRCGSKITPEDQFCPSCGQSLAASPLSAPPPAPWVAPVGIQASGGRWIGEAWGLVKQDMGTYVLMALLFALLNSVPLIQGALIAGFHIYTMKRLMGRNAELGDMFKGFNFFIPTLVASLLIALFTFIGFCALIIPALIVAAMYKFTYLFIVDKRMDFWPAMQASHAVVKNDYLGFTWFLVLSFLVNILGFLCCFVGLLVTIPVTFVAITIAYRELVGFDQRTIDAL